METEIINISKSENKEEIYSKLTTYYKEGKLVAIPTETVYGLSANAMDDEAVSKIYEAKGRPSDNPLIVHFYEMNQLDSIVDYNDENVKKLINNFWPGPMTLILNAKDNNGVSKKVTAGLNTLAVRMPSNITAREILKETEVLLAAPSANTSGKPSPTKFEHVYHDLNGKIDVIIEDEQSDIGLESTVIDCTRYPLVIARPGEITKEDIEGVLGEGSVKYNEEILTKNATPIAPGMKYRHYSPDAELVLFDDSFEKLINILKEKSPQTILSTYLGAHYFDTKMGKEKYIDFMINEVMPVIKKENLAQFCDVWCDEGYYNAEDCYKILKAGLENDMLPTLHTECYSAIGGAKVAAELKAANVGHLNYISSEDIKLLKEANVVGVLIPSTDFSVKHKKPFVPKPMLDEGMTIAIATNLNPGNWVEDMNISMILACRNHKMTENEAIRATTLGGAKALKIEKDYGSLEVSKFADIQIRNSDSYKNVVYKFGVNEIEHVIKNGKIIF